MATIVTGYINASGPSSFLNYTTPQAWNDAAPADLTYTQTGACQTGSTLTYIRLANAASSVNDFYKGRPIIIYRNSNGTQTGPFEVRVIISYDGALRTAYVASIDGAKTEPLTAIPPAGSAYIIDSMIWRGVLLSSFSGTGNQLTIGGSTVSSTCYKEIAAAPVSSYSTLVKTKPLRIIPEAITLTASNDSVAVLTVNEQYARVTDLQLVSSFTTFGGSAAVLNLLQRNAVINRCYLQSGSTNGSIVAGTGGLGSIGVKFINSVFARNQTAVSYLVASIANLYGDFSFLNCLFVTYTDYTTPTCPLIGTTAISNSIIANCVSINCGNFQKISGLSYENCFQTGVSNVNGVTNSAIALLGIVDATVTNANFKTYSTSPLVNAARLSQQYSGTDFESMTVDITGTERTLGYGGTLIDAGPWQFRKTESSQATLKFLRNVKPQAETLGYPSPVRLFYEAANKAPAVGSLFNFEFAGVQGPGNSIYGPGLISPNIFVPILSQPFNPNGFSLVVSLYLTAQPINSNSILLGTWNLTSRVWALTLYCDSGGQHFLVLYNFDNIGLTANIVVAAAVELGPATFAITASSTAAAIFRNGTMIGYNTSITLISGAPFNNTQPYGVIQLFYEDTSNFSTLYSCTCYSILLLRDRIDLSLARTYSQGINGRTITPPPKPMLLKKQEAIYKMKDTTSANRLVGAFFPRGYIDSSGSYQSYNEISGGTDYLYRATANGGVVYNDQLAILEPNHTLFVVAFIASVDKDTLAIGNLYYDASTNFGVGLRFHGDTLEVNQANGNSDWGTAYVTGAVTTGLASYACVLTNPGTLYKNGALLTPTSTTALPASTFVTLNYDIQLGECTNGSLSFSDKPDGVILLGLHYNYALSAAEIARLHNSPFKDLQKIALELNQPIKSAQQDISSVARSKPLSTTSLKTVNKSKLSMKQLYALSSQPQSPFKLNRAHPCAEALVTAFVGSTVVYDAATEATGTLVNYAGKGATKQGIGPYFSSAAAAGLTFPKLSSNTPLSHEFTVLVGCAPTPANAIKTMVSFQGTINSNTRSICANMDWNSNMSNGCFGMFIANPTGSWYTSAQTASTVIDGNYHVFGAVKSLSVIPKLYVDGVSKETLSYQFNSTNPSYMSDVTKVRIGSDQFDFGAARAYTDATGITFAFVWNRALSSDEIRMLSINPWQLLTMPENIFRKVT